MSQYPYSYGYGQNHGQHPPHPYSYQTVGGFPAFSHNSPYNPSAAQENRDASQAAYELNAIHIPGLGVGGAAPSATQHNFPPGAAAWIQPPGFLTVASGILPSHTDTARFSDPQRIQPARDSGPNVATQPPNKPAPAAARPADDVEMEEGELSEGQFEDLYEPREFVPDATTQTPVKRVPLPAVEPSQPASAADTPDGGFYGSDEDDGGRDARGNEVRERSASYSPFLSPRETQSGIPTPQPVADKEVQPASGQRAVEAPKSTVPGLQRAGRTVAATLTGNGPEKVVSVPESRQKDPLPQFRSLQEAKKEAQKAILRLWPLGVKYQNYIDEGFDEKVVKGLFRDLHLDIPKPAADKSTGQPEATQSTQPSGIEVNKLSQPSDKQLQTATSTAKTASAMSDQLRKGEERKDRIARLLAAKAAKAPPASNPPAPEVKPKQDASRSQPQDSAPAPPAPVPAKSKTWGEKERLLQQKIAALQKSREAQKSAADAPSPGATTVSSNGTHVPPAKTTSSPAPLTIPTGPRASSLPQPSTSAQAAPSQPRPTVPALVMSPDPQPISSTQRKRPVASDFVEYSAGPVPPKRPFGQVRNETSFIIDVSDESGDEEMDIDMDMGSPVDETMPIRSSGTATHRGPAIRDFPPLTDSFPPRKYSSPAPSVTPPSGLIKRRETELDIKEKAIQDMRRKIALAEAKRKLKQSSGGSVTPKQAEPSSDPKDHETRPPQPAESVSSSDRSDRPSPQLTPEPSSAEPPKPSETRRGRLLSLEIPRVETSLTEKLRRLEQLRDEEAQLKAEIDRALAEQKKLADELQQLDTAPTEERPQPKGESPEAEPDRPSSPCVAAQGNGQQQTEAVITQTGSAPGDSEQDLPSPTSASDRSPATGDEEALNAVEVAPETSRKATPAADKITENDIGESVERGKAGPNHVAADSSSAPTSIEASLPEADAVPETDKPTGPVPSPALQPGQDDVSAADIAAPMDIASTDEATPMELESKSPSPEMDEPVSSSDAHPPASLPDQISSVAQPREAVQEIEAGTTGEVYGRPASASTSAALMPYETPLRYFRSFRFHPDYQDAVGGGLKSLTYSNRIDTERELCPYELTGEQCPENCEFQHFRSISPPDDQILLELGNPDDYSGEQKARFIQGLRELLQKFKADKVKDFDTIARGIIEFRSQLLGNKYNVLRLDGVKI